MTAGLPGAGIGGLFYLACALLMPVREGYRRIRGRGTARWRLAWMQAGLAIGMLAGIAFVGLSLEWLLAVDPRIAARIAGRSAAAGGAAPDVLRAAALFLGLGTLVAVLVGVETLRLGMRRRERGRRAVRLARLRDARRARRTPPLKTLPER